MEYKYFLCVADCGDKRKLFFLSFLLLLFFVSVLSQPFAWPRICCMADIVSIFSMRNYNVIICQLWFARLSLIDAGWTWTFVSLQKAHSFGPHHIGTSIRYTYSQMHGREKLMWAKSGRVFVWVVNDYSIYILFYLFWLSPYNMVVLRTYTAAVIVAKTTKCVYISISISKEHTNVYSIIFCFLLCCCYCRCCRCCYCGKR